MDASRQVEIPYFRGVGRQRRWRFVALAQVFGRTAIPFLRKYIVPAGKRLGDDLLEFAAPDIAEVVSGKKNFKTAAKSVGRQTLRKQLGSGSRKTTTNRIIPTKSAEQISRSRRNIFTNIFHYSYRVFSVPTFCGRFWNSGREIASSWRCLVVTWTRILSYYLQRSWISNGWELFRWFETEVLGSEIETCQGSWLRNLQKQRSKKEDKIGKKADEVTVEEEQEAPIPLVTYVNNILLSVFSNVEVYINNQQFYNSNAHKAFIFSNFPGAISDYKAVLHCEVYEYEEFPD